MENKWRRHRGGKQPVANGVIVKYRMRSSRESSDVVAAEELRWDHSGSPGDIMSYKVVGQAEKSAPEPAKEPAQSIDTPNPIQWRDRVKELDERKLSLDRAHAKHTADIAKEREELIGKLACQGFQLIDSPVDSSADIRDWRNWIPGDIVTYVKGSCGAFTSGSQYEIRDIRLDNINEIAIVENDDGNPDGWRHFHFKWHSRPSK